MRQPCVYILASRRNGTLYIGVTSHLVKRMHEHQSRVVEVFTRRHDVHMLVWFELHDSVYAAITREKAIKQWRRAWKLKLIESTNPQWRDLFPDIIG